MATHDSELQAENELLREAITSLVSPNRVDLLTTDECLKRLKDFQARADSNAEAAAVVKLAAEIIRFDQAEEDDDYGEYHIRLVGILQKHGISPAIPSQQQSEARGE